MSTFETRVVKGKVEIARAHYHAIAATQEWAAFAAAMKVIAVRTPQERAAREAQRKRETTYDRGELGYS